MEYRIETLGAGIDVFVTPRHTFGTDAFLLSDFAAPRRIDTACDLGTGCGIVPLLWFRGGGPRRVWAVDIQSEAVELAARSAARSGLADRFIPLEADLRHLRGRLPAGQLDLVTCNPPYYRAGSGYQSRDAGAKVARHETMCTLEDVCDAAAYLLKTGGRLCVCHLPQRLADVCCAMRASGIEPKRLRFVQPDGESAPWLLLAEGKRGARPTLTVQPPLLMRAPHGGESPELRRIYQDYRRTD